MNFMERGDWWVHCIASDAKTPISPHVSVKTQETLIRLLRYVGAGAENIAEVESCIRQWHRGSVRIQIAPGRKNLLRLRKPWSDGLE